MIGPDRRPAGGFTPSGAAAPTDEETGYPRTLSNREGGCPPSRPRMLRLPPRRPEGTGTRRRGEAPSQRSRSFGSRKQAPWPRRARRRARARRRNRILRADTRIGPRCTRTPVPDGQGGRSRPPAGRNPPTSRGTRQGPAGTPQPSWRAGRARTPRSRRRPGGRARRRIGAGAALLEMLFRQKRAGQGPDCSTPRPLTAWARPATLRRRDSSARHDRMPPRRP